MRGEPEKPRKVVAYFKNSSLDKMSGLKKTFWYSSRIILYFTGILIFEEIKSSIDKKDIAACCEITEALEIYNFCKADFACWKSRSERTLFGLRTKTGI